MIEHRVNGLVRCRDDGCVVVSVVLGKDNDLLSPPRISAPGSMDPVQDKELFELLNEEIEGALADMKPKVTLEKAPIPLK